MAEFKEGFIIGRSISISKSPAEFRMSLQTAEPFVQEEKRYGFCCRLTLILFLEKVKLTLVKTFLLPFITVAL